MKTLIDAIDSVISDVTAMTTEEVLAQYERSKGGLISEVFLDINGFACHLSDENNHITLDFSSAGYWHRAANMPFYSGSYIPSHERTFNSSDLEEQPYALAA